jgi:HemY protein
MARRGDTKLLGLRGLYIEAQRRNDAEGARLYAEEAAKASPHVNWASQAVLDHRCAAGDWAGALVALDAMKSSLDKSVFQRQRAVLLTARAIALEATDRDAARASVLEAVKLAPDLVPAAALAGRLLAEAGSVRKAGKILDAAWRAGPHPEIAAAYANLRPGDSARERRARVRRLADEAPGHVESALALAQASLEAGDFAAARAALAGHLSQPTRRAATLMAEIEAAEGDVGRSREWMARAMRAAPDPAWSADGVVSEHWLPVSPVSGRLDAFQWKVPVAEIGFDHPAIEPEQMAPPEPDDAAAAAEDKPPLPVLPAEAGPARKESTRRRKPEPAIEPIVPIVHVPDDPGPEASPESDPIAEPVPSDTRWDRLRQFFR